MSYNPCIHRHQSDKIAHFQHNYSPKSSRSITFPADSPVTKQEFAEDCDINTIMARYQFNGIMPAINNVAPQYLDATGIDFHEAMNIVATAQTLFQELPSSLRNRFGNDPGAFVDFCQDPKNRAEMKELGLLQPNADVVIPGHVSTTSAAPAANMEASQPSSNLTPSTASQE